MNPSGRKGTRYGLALLGAGIFLASGAQAQQVAVPGAAAGSQDDSVSRSLRTLADNPRSVPALMGAGMASLAGGDAQAALNFFARAEEISPRDGRIKMWIGSALVQLEQPRPALRIFEEAVSLGVDEAEIAGDRGLAYDMLGDQRRAQADYGLALRRGSNAEITRRLALSLGISGDRERALQLLEDQLLVREPAAERTRAFVLALTGDIAGASRAAQVAMPGPQAEAMAPFLARLPSLSPADRALAVNFGHFPGAGQPATPTYAGVYASRDPVTSAGAPDSGRPALGTSAASRPEPASTAARRRPGSEATGGPARTAAANTAAARSEPRAGGKSSGTLPAGSDRPRASQPEPGAVRSSQPVGTLAVRERQPEPAVPQPVEPQPAADAESGSRLADVAATLANLPDEKPAVRPARTPSSSTAARSEGRAATPSAGRQARTAAASAKKAVPAPPREPSRVWVQVAGGANRGTLPREYARLKAKAPRLLGSRAAWTVPANATNRLLVGPFATNREAQAFINELAKADVAGFAWTSVAGQKVERLPAK